MKDIAGKYIAYYTPVWLLFIVFAMGFCETARFYSISFIILFPWLILLIRKRQTLPVTWIDGCVLIVLLYELALQFSTINSPPSLFFLSDLTLTVVYYFVLRIYLTGVRKIRYFLLLISIFFIILGLLSIVAFENFRAPLQERGIENLYQYRAFYTPVGNVTNMWGSALIGMIGTVCLCACYFPDRPKARGWLIGGLIVLFFCGLLSFSRGVYLALGTLVLVFFFWLFQSSIKRIRKLRIGAWVIGSIFLLSIPFQKEILTTLQFTATVSQQRSIAGRLAIADIAKESVREFPIMGAGSGNYSLTVNDRYYEETFGRDGNRRKCPFDTVGICARNSIGNLYL